MGERKVGAERRHVLAMDVLLYVVDLPQSLLSVFVQSDGSPKSGVGR